MINSTSWAEDTLKKMSLKEKIAQLFHVKAFSNLGIEHYNEINQLIDLGIGGISFFQGNALKQAELTNDYQKQAKIPLLIAIDAEWGLSMRLDNIEPLPYSMTLGATTPEMTEKVAEKIAQQLKLLGVHINFAPVADVNNNAQNPVINFRSFGENKEKVSQHALAYMRGLQKNGILAVAKHFPGHGDTATDSHSALPIINHSQQRLEDIELYPFKKLIENNIDGIMTAHIHIPIWEKEKNVSATLSPYIIQKILKEKLAFKGLIFTDALDMKGITQFIPANEVAVRAIRAGNDVLLLVENVAESIGYIQDALEKKIISEQQIDASCLKQLRIKEKLALYPYKKLELDNLQEKINFGTSEIFREVAQKSITLVKSEKTFPLKSTNTALLLIGATDTPPSPHSASHLKDIQHHDINLKKAPNSFEKYLSAKNINKIFHLSRFSTILELENILQDLANADEIVISLHNLGMKSTANFGVTENLKNILFYLKSLSQKIIFCLFGNPYILNGIPTHFGSILVAYQDNIYTQEAAAKVILGEIYPIGNLPVSINL